MGKVRQGKEDKLLTGVESADHRSRRRGLIILGNLGETRLGGWVGATFPLIPDVHVLWFASGLINALPPCTSRFVLLEVVSLRAGGESPKAESRTIPALKPRAVAHRRPSTPAAGGPRGGLQGGGAG